MIGSIFIFYGLIVLCLSIIQSNDHSGFFIDLFQFGEKHQDSFNGFVDNYLLFIFLFSIFWLLSFSFFKLINKTKLQDINRASKPGMLPGFSNNRFLIFTVILLNIVSLFLTYGSGVFMRSSYHEVDSHIFHVLYKLTLIISVIWLLFSSIRIRYLLVFIIILLSLSISSRVSGGIFLIAGIAILGSNKKKSAIFFTLGVFLELLALFFRGQQEHGLINYLIELYTNFSGLYDVLGFLVSYAFNFSFFASLATFDLFQLKGITEYDLLTMINPLPGLMTNWYEINTKYSLTKEAPFTSLGLLVYLLIYKSYGVFCVVGLSIFVAFLDYTLVKLSLRNKLIFLLSLLFGIFFVMFFYQYDLRTSMRYLYYSLFIYFVFMTNISKMLKDFMRG